MIGDNPPKPTSEADATLQKVEAAIASRYYKDAPGAPP
jgi:hypothetical protein